MIEKQKFLAVIDGSYASYFMLFSAVNEFERKYPDDAAVWIKPADECDQKNLPDLLNCMTFRRVLKQTVIRRLETIDSILRQNFQDEIDAADQIDIIFAMDDKLSNNFRKELYPEYKAQRALVKRQYQLQPIKDYIVDIVFKELDVENQQGYKLVKVEGAEGDDVIATVLTKFKDKYIGTALIASDHDFLQIPGVREFDLFGKESVRKLGDEIVEAEDFLLGKILMGDKSDNIKQVFVKCGPKTALKLIKDKPSLKKMLIENQDAASRFKLNKKIISFNEIPTDLSDRIVKKINETLYSNDVMNPTTDLKSFMML